MTNKQMLAKLAKLKKTGVYLDGFACREDVFREFSKTDDKDIQIVYAEYDTSEAYSGSATVIYYRTSTKKYYETYGSHCSCFGLEGQWEGDEEIVVEELFKRLPVLGTK
jgi:hypothetical protein